MHQVHATSIELAACLAYQSQAQFDPDLNTAEALPDELYCYGPNGLSRRLGTNRRPPVADRPEYGQY